MKGVKFDVAYSEPAGRMELLIRFFWSFICSIIQMVLGIVASFAMVLQFFHILFMGKRNRALFDWTKRYMKYTNELSVYSMMLTDERCPLMPED